MNVIDEIVRDLREALAGPSQTHTRQQAQELLAAVDPILASAGEPLTESRKTVSEYEARELLVDCAARVTYGQILTGKHREYLLQVLSRLLDPKVSAAREVRTFSKARGNNQGLIRTESGWKSDPEHVTDEGVALAIADRMDGTRMGLSPCGHAEALKWAAGELHKDERHVARREAAYWKAWGKPRGKGRPKSDKVLG